MSDLDANFLRTQTSELVEAITSPAFVEAMRQMRLTPLEQRLEVAAKLLNPDVLRAQGVPLPTGIRISSRYFEPGTPAIDVNDFGAFNADDASNPLAKQFMGGGCAGGGAATACGCAGGWTG